MKKTFLVKMLPAVVLAGVLIVTLISFGQTNSGSHEKDKVDTPPTKHKQVRDLDEALQELNNGEVDLNKALKEIDGEKIEREVREALKNVTIDGAKMKEEMRKAMKELDKMNIDAEVKNALKEVNSEKIKEQVNVALAQVDMGKMKLELEKVKDLDLSKLRVQMENLRPELEKSMNDAKKDIEKARSEITSYKNLVDALDKDGLLNKKTNYKVEYRNNQLTVNGKLLPADVTKKYSEYLIDKKDFTLQKDDDDFHINN